jgi:integrase
MSVQKLPSGRWRAQAWDGHANTKVTAAAYLAPAEKAKLGERKGTFPTEAKARTAVGIAATRIEERRHSGVTVAQWRERWLTDPLWARPSASTNLNYAERTMRFVERYGPLNLNDVDDAIVSAWIAGGQNRSTVQVLRTMFNDAMSAEAGRLVRVNPFAGLRLSRSRGNKDKQPPTVEQMAALISLARELTTPSFADYLEFAGLTAMRPGEMDGLGWDEIDAEGSEVDVRRQWNAKAQRFTTPKYGCHRVSLVSDAHAVLERAAAYRRGGVPWVFPTERGHHFTPSSRNHHWNRVRAAAGLGDMTLYLATRHFCAWRLYVVLGLPKEVVAAQLGHKDGGKLIEELYGHPDTGLRLRAVREAYNAARVDIGDRLDASPAAPALREHESRPSLRAVGRLAPASAA